ncbi:MAG: hypothetical protein M1819_002777 [Sarea resinae]|nr:MAG: hypothetical protein M1819_002777 [Sarea resinae]
MSGFPRFSPGDFAPIFRLLDDYDVHRASHTPSSIRAFQPKFDVREVKDSYELHGELPGINQEDVNIEFVDPHTLVISGHTERSFTKGTPPAGAIGNGKEPARLTHKATVEDEDAASQPQEAERSTAAAEDEDSSKYWVSERSVGEFHRTFTFPTRVNQDAVKASLKNGILSIVVPKTTAPQSRRIQIE